VDVGSEHPEVAKIQPIVHRSLQRPDKQGFTRAFLHSLHNVDVRTPSGLYLRQGVAQSVDFVRINRVVARTVKGVYYSLYKQRMPNDYDVRVMSFIGEMSRKGPKAQEEMIEPFRRTLSSVQPTVIGDNVFSYRHRLTDEDHNTGMWLLTFYGSIHFLCVTASLTRWAAHGYR
jgi:hypothetical protein